MSVLSVFLVRPLVYTLYWRIAFWNTCMHVNVNILIYAVLYGYHEISDVMQTFT